MSPQTPEQQVPQRRPRKSSRSRRPSVLSYLIILFLVAFLLLMIAYFQQQRINSETTNDALKQSASAVQSIQILMEENQNLKAQLEELEKEKADAVANAQAQAIVTQQQADRVYALKCLNKLRYLYNNDRSRARTYLKDLGDNAARIETLLGEVAADSDPADVALYDPQKSWKQLVSWLG